MYNNADILIVHLLLLLTALLECINTNVYSHVDPCLGISFLFYFFSTYNPVLAIDNGLMLKVIIWYTLAINVHLLS